MYGAASGNNAVSSINRPRKGYRYGGYHTQAQMNEVSEMDDEWLDSHGVGKVAEVESNLGDGSQSQQAMGPNTDKDHEGWITLDMVNNNGSSPCNPDFVYIYSQIRLAFNSILRVLHHHSPPSLSSSFTHSRTAMDSPISPNIFNTSPIRRPPRQIQRPSCPFRH